MKFLADMGISPLTVTYLFDLGHATVDLRSQGLQQMPDPAILDKAQAEDRILLTHDLDFGDLLAISGANLPSVIIFRLRNMRPEKVNHVLNAILDRYSDLLTTGVVMSVSEGQFRVRALPLDL